MKVYTIEDLKNFERDEYGRLICPSGDYTQIESFGEWCSFDMSCSFGELCSFNRASSRMARIPSAMRSFSSLILRSSRVVGFGWMYMPRYSLRDICMVLGLRTGG